MILRRFMQHVKEQNWFAVRKIPKNKTIILLTIPFFLMGCQTMDEASDKALAAVVVLPVMAIAGIASAISNSIGDDCKSDCQNLLMTASEIRQSKFHEARELTYQQCSQYIQTNSESNLCHKENFKICVNGVAEELYKNNTISVFQKHDLIDQSESYSCDEVTILDLTDNLENKRIKFAGSEYQFVYEQVSWQEAKRLAEQAGGHLAVFETEYEYSIVLKERRSKSTLWIGLTDEDSEGNWIWVTGREYIHRSNDRLQHGRRLSKRDYAHIMKQGAFGATENSGTLPSVKQVDENVQGYIIEWKLAQ